MTSVPAAASGPPVGGSGRASLEPSMLSAALAHAERGWAVLPLRPSDKQPLLRACGDGPQGHKPGTGRCGGGDGHGVNDATTDPATIRRWWAETPHANIGVATGPVSGGLVVLDVDRRNDGPRSLTALEAAHGPLPKTLTASTADGYHRFYRHDGVGLRAKLAGGIDVRAAGAYVVAAPSLHPSGARYEWTADPASIVDLPPWVAEGLARDVDTRPRIRTAGLSPAVYDLARAVPATELPDAAHRALYVRRGSRHGAIRSAALSMLRHGYTVEEAGATILSSPLAGKAREKGPGWLPEELDAAASEIAATPEGLTAAHFLEEVAAHEAAADAAVDVWAGRRGRTLRQVLSGFQSVARERGGGVFTASMRGVADACAPSRSTVCQRWPELVRAGWLEEVQAGGPHGATAAGTGFASRWRLVIPSGRRRPTPAAAPVSPAPAIRADHPALRREALGAAGDTLRMLVAHGPRTVRQLADLLGATSDTAGRHVRKLESLGLAERGGRGRPVEVRDGFSDVLDRLAVESGAVDAQREAAERHDVERDLFGDYLAETDPRHCTSCGQRLSPRGGCPDCDAGAVRS